MLKKVGIVAATATAGMLAVAPLAFAHGGDQVNSNKELHQGLVNVSDNNVNAPVTACGTNLPINGLLAVQVSDVVADLTGAANGNAASLADQSQDRSCDVAAAAGDTSAQSND